MLFYHFFAIFILFKNWFNESTNRIVSSLKNNWLSKVIINTHKFIRKTTKNV